MKETWELWGRRILDRRRELGLTQTELAFKLDVYQSSISRWERGNPPSDEMRLAVAIALGTTVEALFPWPAQVAS